MSSSAPTSPFLRLSSLCTAKPRSTIAIWFLTSALLGAAGLLFPLQTQIPGPASREALLAVPGEKLAFEAGIPPKDNLSIVLGSSTLRVNDAQYIKVRDKLVEVLLSQKVERSNVPVFANVRTMGHNETGDAPFIAPDRRHLLILAETQSTIDLSAKTLKELPAAIAAFRLEFPAFTLNFLSQGTGDTEMFALIDRDLDRSLVFTLPITFAILYWAFGSFLAALLPLVIAVVSLISSLGAAAVCSHLFGPVNATASQLVVLLVLALGVDYSLFILTRVRQERDAGSAHSIAVKIAQSTTGITVFWSGLTVALSLLGLFLMNDTVLRSMALVSVIAVLITAVGSVAVLPCILLLMNDLTEAKRNAFVRPTFMRRWLIFSLKHPAFVLLAAGGLVLAVSLFALQMRLGSTIEAGLLPKNLESSRAYAALAEHFPDLTGSDFSIIVKGTHLDGIDFEEKFQGFLDSLYETHENVRGPIAISRNEEQTLARYSFLVLGNANSPQSQQVVADIKEQLLPQLYSSHGIEAYLSGRLPYVVDDSSRYSNRTPVVFFAVLFLSAVLLLIVFRSVVIPVNAILLNCLSTGASFGGLVYIFQLCPNASWHYSVIEGFVPALLFCILFGLSMDYHLLLIARIREEAFAGKSMKDAIECGVLSTSGAINSAALIMVSVFAVVASLELPVMKELGVGLSIAIALDATIIRSMLLPASMQLLGRWNWYLPQLLAWLPNFQMNESATKSAETI